MCWITPSSVAVTSSLARFESRPFVVHTRREQDYSLVKKRKRTISSSEGRNFRDRWCPKEIAGRSISSLLSRLFSDEGGRRHLQHHRCFLILDFRRRKREARYALRRGRNDPYLEEGGFTIAHLTFQMHFKLIVWYGRNMLSGRNGDQTNCRYQRGDMETLQRSRERPRMCYVPSRRM